MSDSLSTHRTHQNAHRPLYQTRNGQWRALIQGTPTQPGPAFAYISRSFRQTTPYIVGALRLLAQSYEPQALNQKAWSLYADFRPRVEGWGQRGDVRYDTILALRKSEATKPNKDPDSAVVVKFENSNEQEPALKRQRNMALEEYEAELDQDTTFDQVNLDLYHPS